MEYFLGGIFLGGIFLGGIFFGWIIKGGEMKRPRIWRVMDAGTMGEGMTEGELGEQYFGFHAHGGAYWQHMSVNTVGEDCDIYTYICAGCRHSTQAG